MPTATTTRTLRQLAHSPGAAGTAMALIVSAVALGAGASVAAGVPVGAVAGAAWGFVIARLNTIERRLRSSEDAAVLDLKRPVPMLGEWTPEPDFLRVVEATVLQRGPALTVELGSGISTSVIAGALESIGAGRLVAVDHDASFLERTRRRLDREGTSAVASLIHAPLEPFGGGGHLPDWYRLDSVEAAVGQGIDLLVVDGPPELLGPRATALQALERHLNDGAVVLFDDGRGRQLTRAVRGWARGHDGWELAWLDTIRGTWVLTSGSEASGPGLVKRVFRSALPHPTGLGRGPYGY